MDPRSKRTLLVLFVDDLLDLGIQNLLKRFGVIDGSLRSLVCSSLGGEYGGRDNNRSPSSSSSVGIDDGGTCDEDMLSDSNASSLN